MNEESLFHQALAQPAADRAAFLDQACAGNPKLRASVEALMAAHEASLNPLDQPIACRPAETQLSTPDLAGPATCDSAVPPDDSCAAEPAAGSTATYSVAAQPHMVVAGRYALQQRIGEGGMGEVWVAKQSEPVKRRVALKLIKAGMDSRDVLQRFEQERQALALMDHPNIARVFDGGLTPERRPFFVMELVSGLPLTKFCDDAMLGVRERLELFVPICQAVQHAHQKGIVHRDLKPANILVTMIDGRPVPKVIDFGVAKATSGRLTDESLSTQFGAVVGTLEYMSPEQAGFAGEDIDTRTDIYSLGVILYELLTGLRPIDAALLKKAAFTEMIRIIREQEPSKPSTRVSTDKSLPSLAALRQTEPRKLTALLRGELDWVVMKCLEKQRDRRYETASALARELERYLADEPVEARPPSAGYRFGKFVRRNRLQVIAASLVLIALVLGFAGASFGLVHAERARKNEAAQRQLAQQNEAKANTAADLARQAGEREAAQRARAERARDRTREALDAMTSTVIGDSITTQKEISAEQKKFLTDVLTYYREFAGERADDEQSRARTAAAAFRVGAIEARLGRADQALAAFQMARDGYSTLSAESPAVSDYQRELARCLASVANTLRDLGQRVEAQEQLRTAIAIREKLAADFPSIAEHRVGLARAHRSLATLLADTGNHAQAETRFRTAIAEQEKLVAEFPTEPSYGMALADTCINLGSLLRNLGRRPEAGQQWRIALTVLDNLAAKFPAVPAHRQSLASAHNNLGLLLSEMHELSDAESHQRKAIAITESLTTDFPAVPEHRQNLSQMYLNMGAFLLELNKLAEAESQFRQALPILEKLTTDFPTVPTNRYALSVVHSNLSLVLRSRGKWSDAEVQNRKAVAMLESLVADFPTVPAYCQALAGSHNNLGNLLGHTNPQAAEQELLKALAVNEKLVADFPAVPEHQISLGGNYCNFANLVQSSGRSAESLDWYAKAIHTLAAVHEQDRRLVQVRQFLLNSYTGQANAHRQLQQYTEEITDWDRIIELSPQAAQPSLRVSRVHARVRAGQFAEAMPEVAELTKLSHWNAEQWYNFARVCAGAAKDSDKKQEYADRAVELLQQAIKAGWKDVARMKNDSDLDPLRAREDFQKILADLESRSN